MLEKRKTLPNYEDRLAPGAGGLTIFSLATPSVEPLENDDLNNGWSYRIAAVHSNNFYSGPGARLFYHADQTNIQSNHLIQELKCYKKNEIWILVDRFANAAPNSHLSATIDESTKILRLFYSSGNETWQEQVLNITDPNAVYIETSEMAL